MATTCFAFTLIEQLIVLLILSTLAAVVIPQPSSSSQSANSATHQTSLKMVQNAIDRYYLYH